MCFLSPRNLTQITNRLSHVNVHKAKKDITLSSFYTDSTIRNCYSSKMKVAIDRIYQYGELENCCDVYSCDITTKQKQRKSMNSTYLYTGILQYCFFVVVRRDLKSYQNKGKWICYPGIGRCPVDVQLTGSGIKCLHCTHCQGCRTRFSQSLLFQRAILPHYQ